MLRSLLALSALIAPAVALASPASDLAAVQAHLKGLASMSASFTQTDRAGRVTTGQLLLKRPGKIRFQYEKSVPILIVSDGKALTFIDYSVNQKQRWPIGNSPLAVLLDPGRDISRIAHVMPTANPGVISVEASDPKRPEYGRITLIFVREAGAPAGLELAGWVALDSQNNRTTIRLTNRRFNVPISDGSFRYSDPRSSGPRK